MTFRPLAAALVAALGLVLPLAVTSGSARAETSSEPPTEVSVVVALTVPATPSGILDSETLEDYTGEFGLLTRELDAVIDRPVTIGIDPMIIASIRLLGSSAPESAVQWLDRLSRASNDTFPLSWADADVTASIQAGSPTVLAPLSLDFAIDSSRFGDAPEQPTSTPTPGSEPTTDPVDPGSPPPLPTTESLLEWDYTLPALAWPRMGTVVAADLPVLAASFDGVILSSANLAAKPEGALATADDLELVVDDATLSGLLTAAVQTTTVDDWETAVAALDAALTTAAGSSTSIVLTLDRAISLADDDLAPTLDRILDNPSIAPVGLSVFEGDDAPAATLVESPQDADRVATVTRLLADEQAEAAFLQIAADPGLLTAQRRIALLAVLSSSIADDDVAWPAAALAFEERSASIRSAVQIVRSSAITLWADRGSLPVVVENNLSQAVTVYIRVRPSLPLLRVEDDFLELTIEPNSQRKAQIPVQSISNGDVDLQISLHKSNDAAIGETTHVRTTVQAGWETPVTIVAAVLVGLVFIAGIIRTILKRRRLREETE